MDNISKICKYLIVSILLLIGPMGFSQKGSMDLLNYNPASPNAASLGNQGLYSVNKNLGNANIGIPIYTLSYRDLKVPISINYKTSGIRLNDLASWIGLGWTLNAGGAIIRNTKGLPDRDYYEQIPDLKDFAFNQNNWGYLLDVVNGLKDTAPDQYILNALGITGTFYFDRKKQEVVFEETQQICVETISEEEIHIVLEDGTIMIFGTGSDGRNATERTNSNLTDPYYTSDFVSAWYLTELISNTRQDTVFFRYKEYVDAGNNNMIEDYSMPATEKVILEDNIPYDATNFLKAGYFQLSKTNKKYIDSISFKNGYIKFESSLGRLDLEDDYKLDAIKVYMYESSGYRLIDEFHFVYDYFNRSGGNFSNDYENLPGPFNTTRQVNSRTKSLKLMELVRGAPGNDYRYKFEYNSETLPLRCSTAMDFWGYCNNNTGSLVPETFTTAEATNVVYFKVGNGDRNSDETKMKAGVLEKITYPTGGYTEFEYEANKYKTTEPVMKQVTVTARAYGDQCNDDPMFPGYVTNTFTIPQNATNIKLIKQFTPVIHQGNLQSYIYLDGVKYYRPGPDPNCPDCAQDSSPGGSETMDLTFGMTLQNSPLVKFNPGTHEIRAFDTGTVDTLKYPFTCSFLSITLSWDEPDSMQQVEKAVGGLRIKSIKRYDGKSTTPISIKKYEYSIPNLIQPFRNKGYIRKYYSSADGMLKTVVSSSPYFNNNLGGEPVIEYGKVIEYDYDPLTENANGMVISLFENIVPERFYDNESLTAVPFKHELFSEQFVYNNMDNSLGS